MVKLVASSLFFATKEATLDKIQRVEGPKILMNIVDVNDGSIFVEVRKIPRGNDIGVE